jgi:hypothetical protein
MKGSPVRIWASALYANRSQGVARLTQNSRKHWRVRFVVFRVLCRVRGTPTVPHRAIRRVPGQGRDQAKGRDRHRCAVQADRRVRYGPGIYLVTSAQPGNDELHAILFADLARRVRVSARATTVEGAEGRVENTALPPEGPGTKEAASFPVGGCGVPQIRSLLSFREIGPACARNV